MLSNLETTREKLLQIVLVGQPELRQKLAISQLRQLNQRIALRYHLEPLDMEMTREYINFRLRVAGGTEQVHFTPSAVQVIHEFSHGIPRLINITCDKSLLAAYVSESKVVTPSVVKTALADLEPISSGYSLFGSFLKPFLRLRVFLPGLAVMLLCLGLLGWWINERMGSLKIFTTGAFVDDPVQNFLPSQKNTPILTPPSTTETIPLQISPVAEATKETEILTTQVVPYTFDPDGVYRVADPIEAERASYLTLARLWQSGLSASGGGEIAVTPQEFKSLDLARLLKVWGLYQYPLPSEYEKIMALDYPGLVWIRMDNETKPRATVLSSVYQDHLILLDPLEGKIQLSAGEFQSRFTGRGILFWKEIPGISLPLAQGVSDASVRTLQAVLKIWGHYPGPVDGILGTLTQTAIKAFQQQRGLEATGQVGMGTYLVLAQAVLDHKVPILDQGPGAGAQ
jgi:general secretion pathway protein A